MPEKVSPKDCCVHLYTVCLDFVNILMFWHVLKKLGGEMRKCPDGCPEETKSATPSSHDHQQEFCSKRTLFDASFYSIVVLYYVHSWNFLHCETFGTIV